jgi:mono/diheme cytochrome c family protein
MVRFTIALSVILAGAAGGSGGRSSAVAAQQTKTQWDGVYTDAQAKRGDALYSDQCASCHGPELTGGEMAPALTGGDFNSDWDGLALGQLLDRMKTTMPQNSPGSLSRQQNADILAFVLWKASAPAGSTELPSQTELLNQITFKALRP